MGINALQVAWISRLADKKIIRPGDSIIEFSPQDLACSRNAVELYGRRHCALSQLPAKVEELFDGERPRQIKPQAFYELFGITKYRSVDLLDARADWLRDLNLPFQLPEDFDLATNFGTAEHVFNIAAVFHSIHDVLRPGGVALHVLPAFGDIDHGFFNIHPTTYFDLATANNYAIEDLCYVDRWDIRNKAFEADLKSNFDFDGLPIRLEHLRDREILQRMVTNRFVENSRHPDTLRYGPGFAGLYYDYCIVALRKMDNRPFRFPIQSIYAGSGAQRWALWPPKQLLKSARRAPRAALRRVRSWWNRVMKPHDGST